jgi:hypothetical protein
MAEVNAMRVGAYHRNGNPGYKNAKEFPFPVGKCGDMYVRMRHKKVADIQVDLYNRMGKP